MRPARHFGFAAAACVLLAGSVAAQNAISVRAGMINVADGDLYLVDAKGGEPKKVEPKVSEFIDVKEGQILKAEEGRAEVLLTPGSFLRMADGASFQMISNRMTDVRLDVLSGSVLIEVVELLEGNSITVLAKEATVTLMKAGLYRFDMDPARVRVFAGEARVSAAGQTYVMKGGRELVAAANGWEQGKFDAEKSSDGLVRWAKRRSGYIAMANVSSARANDRMYTNALGGTGYGRWVYNPWFGMATFIPLGNTMRSYFGYMYYNPASVMAVYYPRPNYNSGYNGGGGGGNGGFMSGPYGNGAGLPSRSATASYGGMSSAPAASAPAASAPAASAPRAGGDAGARGGSAGGGRGQ